MKKKHPVSSSHIYFITKGLFWFCVGGFLALFFLVSFLLIFFQKFYANKIYPGISVGGIDFSGKTPQQVQQYFDNQNAQIKNTQFTFSTDTLSATVSAKQLHIGYDSKLMATQAYTIGRSSYFFSNFVLIFESYLYGTHLPGSYTYDNDLLTTTLAPILQAVNKDPINAIFTLQNNRVTTFQPSVDGKTVDLQALESKVFSYIPLLIADEEPNQVNLAVPVKIIQPAITTESASKYGIKDLLGEGTSFFEGSAPERIHNVTLAASRVNGVLIAPDEVFSFDKALGDVSQYTGYQQAYVIQNGHTVLGDGGGVCQVSTTFFRAMLHAGLPVVERHAHAYRVHYYEEGGYPMGIDATIYVPSVDLKLKNDTGHWILVQTIINPATLELTVDLYGVNDGRVASISTPVVTSRSPAPPPLYQDDPTLPQGTIKQVDFSADGANVSFTRTVIRNGQVLYHDTFNSNYQPWQAVYLRGTKT